MPAFTPSPARRPALRSALCASGLALLLVVPALHAQPADAGFDDADWTGRPQNDAIARKEAGAALVQGRRDCAALRQRDDKAACLKKVQDDHAAAMKRLGTPKGKR